MSKTPDHSPNWSIIAPALVVLSGFCWGLIGLFTRSLASFGLSALQNTEIRCALAAAVLGCILLIRDRGLLRIRLRDLWMFFCVGVVALAFFNVCYFSCIEECGLSFAAMLLYTGPCFVQVFSRVLFREPFSRTKLAALGLAFAGCLLVVGVFGGGGTLSPFGIAVGLCSGLGYALYSIFSRIALEKYHPFTVAFYSFLCASVVLAPFSNLGHVVQVAAGSGQVIGLMVGLAVIATVIPNTSYTVGLAHMETSRASLMTFIEPMVALFMGVFVFGDVLSAANLLGVALILSAVILLNVPVRENRKRQG